MFVLCIVEFEIVEEVLWLSVLWLLCIMIFVVMLYFMFFVSWMSWVWFLMMLCLWWWLIWVLLFLMWFFFVLCWCVVWIMVMILVFGEIVLNVMIGVSCMMRFFLWMIFMLVFFVCLVRLWFWWVCDWLSFGGLFGWIGMFFMCKVIFFIFLEWWFICRCFVVFGLMLSWYWIVLVWLLSRRLGLVRLWWMWGLVLGCILSWLELSDFLLFVGVFIGCVSVVSVFLCDLIWWRIVILMCVDVGIWYRWIILIGWVFLLMWCWMMVGFCWLSLICCVMIFIGLVWGCCWWYLRCVIWSRCRVCVIILSRFVWYIVSVVMRIMGLLSLIWLSVLFLVIVYWSVLVREDFFLMLMICELFRFVWCVLVVWCVVEVGDLCCCVEWLVCLGIVDVLLYVV